ncbi:MAG: exosortase-associated EpsI family protein [Dehalococcoidia bacterium]|nr:exosortase-associated EpsI family protein [Dehalococcoidia bacterium]
MKPRVGYLTIVGIFLLATSITFMCSRSELLFSESVSFISTELSEAPRHETFVWSKMGLKTNEAITDFPTKLGEWEGYDWDKRKAADLRETLGANVSLMRDYYRPGLYTPIFFLIVQAKESTTLHPPNVCYKALGYHVDEFKDVIQIAGASQDGTYDNVLTGGTVPIKKLVVSKTSEGQVVERRVALYCYLRGGQFTPDTINLIRISAIVPVEGSYDGILEEIKHFAGLAIPQLFEFRQEEESPILIVKLAGWGARGGLLIFLAFAIPVALIIYPILRKKPQGQDSEK